jgi:hypothetical protein
VGKSFQKVMETGGYVGQKVGSAVAVAQKAVCAQGLHQALG